MYSKKFTYWTIEIQCSVISFKAGFTTFGLDENENDKLILSRQFD